MYSIVVVVVVTAKTGSGIIIVQLLATASHNIYRLACTAAVAHAESSAAVRRCRFIRKRTVRGVFVSVVCVRVRLGTRRAALQSPWSVADANAKRFFDSAPPNSRESRHSCIAVAVFPSYTRTNVSNVRRLPPSTVVVVVHGRRPPLAKASALDLFPENDQAHAPTVQLIIE